MLNQDEVPCPECGAFGPHMHNNTKPVAVAMPEVLLHYLKEERQWLTVQESEARQNAREAVAEGVRAACNARAGAMLEAIMAIDRAIARAAAKVQPEPAVQSNNPTRAPVAETAWLLEMDCPEDPRWFKGKNGDMWTRDANEAIRFSRREDACRFRRAWHTWGDLPSLVGVLATEHVFGLDLRAAAPPPTRRCKSRLNRTTQTAPKEAQPNMKQPIKSEHWMHSDKPGGGMTCGTGFAISWQNGPLGRGETRREPNGAFVETIIEAALDRLRFYQQGESNCYENALAMSHLEAALAELDKRTLDREKRAVEGIHQP